MLPQYTLATSFSGRGEAASYFGFGEHKEMEKSFTVTRRRNNRITDYTENVRIRTKICSMEINYL